MSKRQNLPFMTSIFEYLCNRKPEKIIDALSYMNKKTLIAAIIILILLLLILWPGQKTEKQSKLTQTPQQNVSQEPVQLGPKNSWAVNEYIFGESAIGTINDSLVISDEAIVEEPTP